MNMVDVHALNKVKGLSVNRKEILRLLCNLRTIEE
jgi:hypothetical protein